MTDAPAPTDVPPAPGTPPADPAAPPAGPAGAAAQPEEPAQEEVPWALKRTLRTAGSESWDLVAAETRIGAITLLYGDESVEGLLALPGNANADTVRGVLGWVTDLLTLDSAAGAGGLIHWTVVLGEMDDFWRRSPGRRPSGAEEDVATTRAEEDVATTRARVEPVLAAMFPSLATTPDGGYAVDTGSVRVFVNVQLVETTVIVRVFSITNVDVPLDGDLPRFLLQLNFTMPLGRFSLDPARRAVWFDHVLTADQVDEASLARVVSAVATTADRYDDEIKGRFGGRTFREEGSPVEATTLAGTNMAGGYL